MGFLESMVTSGLGGRGFQPGMMRGGMGGMGLGGLSPMTKALLGVLAYRTFKGKGRLAEMTGIGGANPRDPNAPQGSMPGGMTGGGMGGALGGLLTGGGLAGGLADLLNRFQQTQLGHKADSWVETGVNEQIEPHELEKALGEERIEWLMSQTKLSREDLLSGLSQTLPETINQLTPEGRLPSEEEAQKLI